MSSNEIQHVKKDAGKFGEWHLLTLFPPTAMRAVARVFEFGNKKYSPHGFLISAHQDRESAKYSRLVNAAFGHFFRWLWGEETDDETGESHLAHLACCVLILLEWHLQKLGTDDRNTVSEENRKQLGRLWR